MHDWCKDKISNLKTHSYFSHANDEAVKLQPKIRTESAGGPDSKERAPKSNSILRMSQ